MSDALFAEVLATAAADGMGAASTAELLAWVSSALGIWREPGVADDPAADDLAWVEWLAANPAEPADRLMAALGQIGDGPARDRARLLGEPLPEPDVGPAWHLGAGEVRVLTFVHPDSDEMLLVDIDRGGFADVQFATAAEDLLATAAGDGEVTAADPHETAAEIAASVAELAASPRAPTDAQLANMALLRARLVRLGHSTPDPSWSAEIPALAIDAEADRAAIATLTAALPEVVAAPAPAGAESMVAAAAELVRWDGAAGRPIQELEGLASLEWADWLGVTLGVVRTGVGSAVSGTALVDHVNRAPEITSSIPKRDRGWYEWVFAVVIESWADLGIVDDARRLTGAGRWALPHALLTAWAPKDMSEPVV